MRAKKQSTGNEQSMVGRMCETSNCV